MPDRRAGHHVHRWVLIAARHKRFVTRTVATFGCDREGCNEKWTRTFYGELPIYSGHDERFANA